MGKFWIADATKKNKGAFRRKAKAAGMSTAAYEAKVLKKGSRASAKTKKEASLARTLARFH